MLCDQVRIGLPWLRGGHRVAPQVFPHFRCSGTLPAVKLFANFWATPSFPKVKNLKNEEVTTAGSLHMSTWLVESRKLCSED